MEVSTDITKDYLKQYDKDVLLSSWETQQMIKEYQMSEDPSLLNRIIKGNARLVVGIAKTFEHKIVHLKLEDLIQEGLIELFCAIDLYDESRGAFSTYITKRVQNRIRSVIANQEHALYKETVYHKRSIKYKLKVNSYFLQHGYEPNEKWLMEELQLNRSQFYETIAYMNNNSFSLLSLSDTLAPNRKDKEERSILDIVPVEFDMDDFLEDSLYIDFLKVIKCILSPDEYYFLYTIVIKKQFDEHQLATLFTISQQNISLYNRKAIKRIEYYLENMDRMYEKLEKVKKTIGNKFNKIRVEPISPDDILKFVFIEPYLNEDEKQLLSLSLLDFYAHSKRELQEELYLSQEKFNEIDTRLKQKIQSAFSNMEEYIRFRNFALTNLGLSFLYNNSIDDISAYCRVLMQYSSMGYDEITSYFQEELKSAAPRCRKNIDLYFRNSEKPTMSLEEVNQKLNECLNKPIDLTTCTKEDILAIVRNSKLKIDFKIRQELLVYFHIAERDVMNISQKLSAIKELKRLEEAKLQGKTIVLTNDIKIKNQ